MEGTEIVTVDYSKIRYYGELHTVLRDTMGWPKWYGCNLDALYDIFYVDGTPQKIIFLGTKSIYKHKGWGESWEKMLEVMNAASAELEKYNQGFEIEIRS